MYSKIQITKPINTYSEEVKRLKSEIKNADAVLIGAGAGLSTAAGFIYDGENFRKHFGDFGDKYRFDNMYFGGFYPYETQEEFWAYWSRYIYLNRYTATENGTYKTLYDIVKDKDYFVLTTNVDHQFQKAGFDKNRLFYTQGDFGLFQCSEPCHQKTYDNEKIIKQMVELQKDMRIPTELIPKCPKCDKPMTTNLRSDNKFVQDEGWYKAAERYEYFVRRHESLHILYLELGVGYNTPVIIKYPFWQMTAKNPKAVYACLNFGEAAIPNEIEKQSICINGDIKEILEEIKNT